MNSGIEDPVLAYTREVKSILHANWNDGVVE